MTEVVRATSRFSFSLWGPEMRRGKETWQACCPAPTLRARSVGEAERAGVSDTLELGLGSRGTQRTWLLRQGKARGWPLEREFPGFKISPGERRSPSLTTTSLPRESGRMPHVLPSSSSFLPGPSRQSFFNYNTHISPKNTNTNMPFKKKQFYMLDTVFRTL